MELGKELAVCHAPPFLCRCLVLYSIIIYLYYSHVFQHNASNIIFFSPEASSMLFCCKSIHIFDLWTLSKRNKMLIRAYKSQKSWPKVTISLVYNLIIFTKKIVTSSAKSHMLYCVIVPDQDCLSLNPPAMLSWSWPR